MSGGEALAETARRVIADLKTKSRRQDRSLSSNKEGSNVFVFVYPLSLESNGEGGFIVTIPDLPEAVAESRTKEEVQADALAIFEGTLAFYVDSHKPFPVPSPVQAGQQSLTILPSLAEKILLHNEMLKGSIRSIDLA